MRHDQFKTKLITVSDCVGALRGLFTNDMPESTGGERQNEKENKRNNDDELVKILTQNDVSLCRHELGMSLSGEKCLIAVRGGFRVSSFGTFNWNKVLLSVESRMGMLT